MCVMYTSMYMCDASKYDMCEWVMFVHALAILHVHTCTLILIYQRLGNAKSIESGFLFSQYFTHRHRGTCTHTHTHTHTCMHVHTHTHTDSLSFTASCTFLFLLPIEFIIQQNIITSHLVTAILQLNFSPIHIGFQTHNENANNKKKKKTRKKTKKKTSTIQIENILRFLMPSFAHFFTSKTTFVYSWQLGMEFAMFIFSFRFYFWEFCNYFEKIAIAFHIPIQH